MRLCWSSRELAVTTSAVSRSPLPSPTAWPPQPPRASSSSSLPQRPRAHSTHGTARLQWARTHHPPQLHYPTHLPRPPLLVQHRIVRSWTDHPTPHPAPVRGFITGWAVQDSSARRLASSLTQYRYVPAPIAALFFRRIPLAFRSPFSPPGSPGKPALQEPPERLSRTLSPDSLFLPPRARR